MKFHASPWSVGRTFIVWCFLAPLLDAVLARVSRTFPCPQACVCDIITLRVDCSRGGFQSLPASLPLNTRILLFQENDMGNELIIPVFNITALVRLRQLSLANNSLSCIDSAVFPKQLRLIKLDFAYNYLEGVPATVRKMRLLKQLHLSHNRLSSIRNDSLPPFSTIEKLYLDYNEIYILEDGAFDSQKRLQNLYMTDNLISNISTGLFSRLSTLTQLDLSYNKIGADYKTQYDFFTDDIPTPKSIDVGVSLQSGIGPSVNFSDWFAPNNASKLGFLNLEGNIIRNIAHDAFKLFPELSSLNMAYNQIVTMPPHVLYTLGNLQILDLSGNMISDLPSELFMKNTRLESINLSGNLLYVLPINLFSYIEQSLLELRLSGNNLHTVPWIESNLRELVELDLSTNALADVGNAGFTHLVSLRRLFLQNNHLVDIPNVRNMTRLQEIYLSNNSIRSISFDAFDGNVALEVIAIDDNLFVTIALEPFVGLPSLHAVKAAGNPFNCDCNVKWMSKFDYDEYSYQYDYNYMYAEEMGIPHSTFMTLQTWIAPLKQEAICAKPNIASGETIDMAIYRYNAELICSHFANPKSIMILILTWFLIIIVFLILFWGRTFWMARKQFGSSRHKIIKEKPKEEDTCYVISAVSKKAGNGQYHLLPDKNENEPLVFLSNNEDESCKLRTFDRNSTEIFIETTV